MLARFAEVLTGLARFWKVSRGILFSFANFCPMDLQGFMKVSQVWNSFHFACKYLDRNHFPLYGFPDLWFSKTNSVNEAFVGFCFFSPIP